MEEKEYIKAYANEERNWYFLSRRNFFFNLINKYIKRKDNKILDIGSGAGMILRDLSKYGDATGLDVSKSAIEFCRARRLKCVNGNAENLPFNDNSFDMITAFGVIEHVNDIKAINEISRVAKEGAYIFIECPAYQFLWSQHDVALHHKRRYNASELKMKLAKAGLNVEKISYIYLFLFFPAALFRIIRKAFGKKKAETDPFEKIPSVLNYLLLKLESIEAKLVNNFYLPFGISLICVARRK